MKRNDKIYTMVMTALILGLVMLSTAIFKIPVPLTQGYVHLGDTMIFLGVLALGRKNGCIAAGIGSALADVIAGYAMYAPWTLVVKGLMAFIMGTFIDLVEGKEKMTVKIAGVPVAEIIGMLLGGAVMVAGYCVADGFFAGNMAAGFLGVPANIGQFVVGMVLASSLAAALYKTPVKRYFVHKIDEV